MKNLIDYIVEGNITNVERKYREFTQLCLGYNVHPEEICVKRTSKKNWIVFKDGKKQFLVSNNILTPEVITEFDIEVCE